MTEGEKAGEVSVAEATRSDTGGSPGGSAGKSQSQALFDEKVSAGETKEAVRLLRAESELDISKDQAWRLLDSIPLDVSEENETEQQILVSLTYAALRKRELLTGFGVVPVSPEALPLASKEVDVAGLEATLGMGMAALTPAERRNLAKELVVAQLQHVEPRQLREVGNKPCQLVVVEEHLAQLGVRERWDLPRQLRVTHGQRFER